MTAALTIPSTSMPVASDMKPVAEFVAESISASTRRAYRSGLKDFTIWTAERGLDTLPASPETVAAYLAACAQAGLSVSSLQKRLAAIKWSHEAQGLETPTAAKGVRSTMSGIRRELGVAPKRKAPATTDKLAVMLSRIEGDSLKALRDRALLLFGFASAMRRSELVALQVEDLEETDRGLLVTVRRGKTDQEGRGHTRAVLFGRSPETCPVKALSTWISAAGLTSGPAFRNLYHKQVGDSLSPGMVARIVKGYAKRAGLEAQNFAGHSLRAGFVTSAAVRGASAERIMDHTGHKSVGMVRVYTRRSDAFADHAGEGLL